MNMTKNVTVRTLGEIRLIGLRILYSGEYLREIPKASKELNERLGEIKDIVNPFCQIGVFKEARGTEKDEGYWICVEVKDFTEIPSGMHALRIPAQKFAVTRHAGPIAELKMAHQELHTLIEVNECQRIEGAWHLEKFYSWEAADEMDVEVFVTIE